MKQIIIIISFFILSASTGYSQDYMTKIAEKSCECIKKISDTLDKDQFEIQLGLCIIDAAMPYKKQIKKEYGIDLDDIGSGNVGERIGKLIGLKMVGICPDGLIKIAQGIKTKKEETKTSLTMKGEITKIDNDCFMVFSLKDETGKITKFYWLTFIESDIEMAGNYASLSGRQVKITYDIQDFFDAKIKEYRQFYIIKKIAYVYN